MATKGSTMEQEAYPHGRWRTRFNPPATEETLTLSFHRATTQPESVPHTVYTFFVAPFPEAEQVQLIGDFTHWDEAPIELQRGRDGCWFTSVPLPAGSYAYAYLVDGVWMLDSTAPKAREDELAFSNIMRVHPPS